MRFHVPDWLSYEIRHKVERLRDRYERVQIKEAINEHPKTVASIALFSILLLILVLLLTGRETPAQRFPRSQKAWFYDLNTGQLFAASSREIGPIDAPSGPRPNGEAAGVKAHVYSYVLDPNESELFVGFLEMPSPKTKKKQLSSDRDNFQAWARGRLVKRVDDENWVSPTGRQGCEIMEALTRPNELGQTPMYHLPR